MTALRFLFRLVVLTSLLALAGCNLAREGDVPAQNAGPTVSFLAPENMAQVRAGDDVPVLILAEDPDGPGIARVALLVNDLPHQEGTPESSEAVPVFTVQMSWRANGQGLQSLTAIAYRADGTASAPATIALDVVP